MEIEKVDDGEENEDEDEDEDEAGDGGDKVSFGSRTHGFTLHPCEISLASHRTPIIGKKRNS